MVGWWQYSVGMENLFSFLLCVSGTPVCSIWICFSYALVWWRMLEYPNYLYLRNLFFLCSCESLILSVLLCGNLFFPDCSIGIYFSSTLVRQCEYLIRCCMSLKYIIPSYLLAQILLRLWCFLSSCMVCSSYAWRLCKIFFCMHTSEISLVVLLCYSFFLNMCSWWLEEVYPRYLFGFMPICTRALYCLRKQYFFILLS
jgi:hypothetical protein